jgi:hypothetical protein
MEILYAIVIIIGLIIGIVNWLNQPSRGKFEQLGDIRGKSLQQVIESAGLPQSYSAQGPGKILAQWMAPGIHVALLFEYRGPHGTDWGNIDAHRHEFICLGVTHQYGI